MKCNICGKKLKKFNLAKEILNEFEFFKLRKIKPQPSICIDCQTDMLFLELS